MKEARPPDHCDICGALIGDNSTICPECDRAFEPPLEEKATGDESMLDLERYRCQMFPWEQTRNQPRLVTSHKIWLILAIALALIVILLALTRAPLPSCWEVS
jgi:hypothetical protein